MTNVKPPSAHPSTADSVPKSTVPMTPKALRDIASKGEDLEKKAHETAKAKLDQQAEGGAATARSARAEAES